MHRFRITDDMQVVGAEVHYPFAIRAGDVRILDVPLEWHLPVEHFAATRNLAALELDSSPYEIQRLAYPVAGDAAAEWVELGGKGVQSLARAGDRRRLGRRRWRTRHRSGDSHDAVSGCGRRERRSSSASNWPRLKSGYAASRSEIVNCGIDTQEIENDGSFQRTPAASSGTKRSVIWYSTSVAGSSVWKPCAIPGGMNTAARLSSSNVTATCCR